MTRKGKGKVERPGVSEGREGPNGEAAAEDGGGSDDETKGEECEMAQAQPERQSAPPRLSARFVVGSLGLCVPQHEVRSEAFCAQRRGAR